MIRPDVASGDGEGTPGGPYSLLHEDDEIAFRIVDAEDAVLEWLDDGDGVGFEVALEACGVTGGEGYRFHPCGWRWRGERFDFKPLRVADRVNRHAVVLSAMKAEGLAVEVCRGGGV